MSDKPSNVIAALACVMAEMPGIGKDSEASAQQGGYKYRGIEAITSEAQRLLGKHGVVFVPHVIDWQTDELTVNGKPWTDTRLRVEYDVFGPGGVEDRIKVGPICAIGRDNSDKGANKCMTQAFKYALLQTLCIGDAKDDGDGASHQADEASTRDEAACTLCGEFIPGALSDPEPMRVHRIDAHNWVRLEDGKIAPPKIADTGTPDPSPAATGPDDATNAEAPGPVVALLAELGIDPTSADMLAIDQWVERADVSMIEALELLRDAALRLVYAEDGTPSVEDARTEAERSGKTSAVADARAALAGVK
jgi:hypothetical protein